MVPKLLIDGYNLLFQSNLVGKNRQANWLDAAKNRLLKELCSRLSQEELATTHLVFDAPKRGHAAENQHLASGLLISYAINHAEADDLLEEIIRQHPTPKLLTVVSSDQRIRRASRAQRASSIDSQSFLNDLERRVTSIESLENPQAAAQLDPGTLSPAEVEYWLSQFNLSDNRKP